MAAHTRGTADAPEQRAPTVDAERRVSALRSTPDRVVFTEEGNTDGWIATDLTVEPHR